MKKEEIIELNGKEYTVTMNRESYIRIDDVVGIKNTMNLFFKDSYVQEIDDDYNPYATKIDLDKREEEEDKRIQRIQDFYTRSFHILLYPKCQFKVSEVESILEPYFKDDKKLSWLSEKLGELLGKCIQIKFEYDEERKNLKAQTNNN